MNAVHSRNAATPSQAGAGPPQATNLLSEFLRYLVVGGAAFAADWAVLRMGVGLGIHYMVATAMGFVVGLAINYLLCVIWVWRGTHATRLRDFAIFTAIGFGGLLLTEGLMWLAVGVGGLSAPLAKIPVTALVMLWNFGLRRVFVFFR